MKVSYPVDGFDKTVCPSSIIFSFWQLIRQTTVSADPPVSADPRIMGTDILKRGIVLSEYCTVYIQATSLLQKL